MKRTAVFLTMILLLASCSTLPERIDEKYLVEKTPEENARLSKIGDDIKEKYRLKKACEETLDAKRRIPEFTLKEIELLEKEYWVLKDQVNLYTKYMDARNLEIRKARLAENEADTKWKKKLNEVQNADIKLAEADLKVKAAELAVSVAELEFEKSRIAATYRDKTETPEKENGKPADDKYGYKIYSDFLEKQRDELKKAQQDYAEAEKKYNEARQKLDAEK